MELNSRPILTYKCFSKNTGLQMKGTVKFFNSGKGYGFITGEDGKDYFVHITALNDQKIHSDGIDHYDENDTVTFEVGQGDRGELAVNVQKTEE